MALDNLIYIFGIGIPMYLLLLIFWALFGFVVALYIAFFLVPSKSIIVEEVGQELQPEEALDEIKDVIKRTRKPKPQLPFDSNTLTGDDVWNMVNNLVKRGAIINVPTLKTKQKKSIHMPKIKMPKVSKIIPQVVPTTSQTPISHRSKREEKKDWDYTTEPP